LLTFVAFGAGLIWTGLEVITARSLIFTGVALLSRTLVLIPALGLTSIARGERHMLALIGPRGLSSLLLVMLAVIARVEGAGEMFAVTSLAVLASIVLHGGGILLLTRRIGQSSSLPVVEEDRPGITIELLQAWRADGTPHVLIDARAERSWETDRRLANDAVRLLPDEPVRSARELGLSQHATLVVYCA